MNIFRLTPIRHLRQRSVSRQVFCALATVRANFQTEAQGTKEMGRIYDKKPTKIELEEGQIYKWCTCGLSHEQPFCDGSHKALNEANPHKEAFRSHKFEVDTKKEYFLCMCKQTLHRPFCDGTHKRNEIQAAVLNQSSTGH